MHLIDAVWFISLSETSGPHALPTADTAGMGPKKMGLGALSHRRRDLVLPSFGSQPPRGPGSRPSNNDPAPVTAGWGNR